MKVKITEPLEYAHKGYDVKAYAKGDEVPEDSDIGRYALENGHGERLKPKAKKAGRK